MRIVSTQGKIERLTGLLGTRDLSPAEDRFVRGLQERMHAGEVSRLTDKQLAWLEDLFERHFAG